MGEALAGLRDHVQIATKYGWDIDQQTGRRTGKVNSQSARVRRVVDNMLRRLRTDRIDLLCQHRADPQVPVEELAGVIQDLMKQGKVLHWGLCEVGPATIRKAHAILPLTAVQSEYSLFFRGREKDVLPVCAELGIGFVPWSPLAMGVLAGHVDDETVFEANPANDLRGIIPCFAPEAMRQNMRLIEFPENGRDRKPARPRNWRWSGCRRSMISWFPFQARAKAGICWETWEPMACGLKRKNWPASIANGMPSKSAVCGCRKPFWIFPKCPDFISGDCTMKPMKTGLLACGLVMQAFCAKAQPAGQQITDYQALQWQDAPAEHFSGKARFSRLPAIGDSDARAALVEFPAGTVTD